MLAPTPNTVRLTGLWYLPSKTCAIFLLDESKVWSLVAAFQARLSYYIIEHSSSLYIEICQEKLKIVCNFY